MDRKCSNTEFGPFDFEKIFRLRHSDYIIDLLTCVNICYSTYAFSTAVTVSPAKDCKTEQISKNKWYDALHGHTHEEEIDQ